MKIERITICNIASLAGIHSVDFTKDPLKTAGLFSISGATGAGKSTLLDALCLALFDQTPRLNQVGRLAELSTGEKQNDTRMLLRRNTAYGFAEVAFVGVDQQQWTARWSVRRGHNKSDGKLQNVEMALYRGHIAPGSQGSVEEGGKKTLVKEAIVAKIGLTFEQFTRAVLLAQNDFATFLKANDNQRAEILQALTGTERFEAISRAVYDRYSNEKKEIETLEAQLQGYQPLTAEVRAEKEAAAATATAAVGKLELEFKQLEVCTEWFRKHAERQANLNTATGEHAAAQQSRDAASERREDLRRTEIVACDARTLREAELRAFKDLETAKTGLEAATAAVDSQIATVQGATEKQNTATTALTQLQLAQQTAAPLLIQARTLDTKLEWSRSRVEKTETALKAPTAAVRDATTKRDAAEEKKKAIQVEQQSLLTRGAQLAVFESFVKDRGTWLLRLETAMTAEAEAIGHRAEFAKLGALFQNELAELEAKREACSKLQERADAAAEELKKVESAEGEFDAEDLATQHLEFDAVHRVLTTLQQELNQWQKYCLDADTVTTDLAGLEATQLQDLATLNRLQEIEIPAATAEAKVAHDLLETMRAAVDDHAKRLRLSLQPEHPCPVCGSESHPYRDHAPDYEATAINAAKEKCKELNEQRDSLRNEEQRLSLSTQAASGIIEKHQQSRAALQTSIGEFTFSSADHSDVAAILALDEDQRQSAVLRHLEANEGQRNQIAANEKLQRGATKLTQKRRKTAEDAAGKLRTQQQFVNDLEKQHGVTNTKHATTEFTSQKSEERWRDAMVALSGLFSELPNASEHFAADPQKFRDSFAESTRTFADVQQQLSDVSGKLNEVAAVATPLEEAVQAAIGAQSASQKEHTAATGERDQHLRLRRQLFDGRDADIVEREFAEEVRVADQNAKAAATTKHDAEKQLAETKTTEKHATDKVAQVSGELTNAQTAMAAWLRLFNTSSVRILSMIDFDQMLARDAAWIETERVFLKQLDERVTSSESASKVHAEQLQQHNELRTTTDEEAVVLAAVQTNQDDLEVAKELQEASLNVVRQDNQHRQQNADLTQRLADQHNFAEPWLKLNELIGSKEGDKFRMIAQRRTLDVLLGYANHQLNQLSARYRLERIPESLNLIVIDCEMGEEKRSVHSLSGGESFLVSLALALGLASLTSNRLRIESLFIDEGFGSLDQETLTIAMNALTHLEAQGRKVGVISHVTEMTDAIPVQIKIEKRRSGGASRIVIPGADPEWVHPTTDFEAGAKSNAATKTSAIKTEDSEEVAVVAAKILDILQREQKQGNLKVSTTALRKEISCRTRPFAAAQILLSGKITLDGRSLRLGASE